MADLGPQLKNCGLHTEDWRPETGDRRPKDLGPSPVHALTQDTLQDGQ